MSETPLSLRILRQEGPDQPETRRWEIHPVAADAVTVADALAAVDGIAWDDRCTWPSCGTCAMVIGGRARPACGTPLAEAADRKGVITLAPLAGFPLRRDLWVDRGRLLDGIVTLSPWLDGDERIGRGERAALDRFARCTRCGACLDACPEVRAGGAYLGAAAFGLSHAARRMHPEDAARLDALTEPGGIGDCGGALACVDACPENLPLGAALREASAVARRHLLRRWLRRD